MEHRKRREFLRQGAVWATSGVVLGGTKLSDQQEKKAGGEEQEVSPAEDLMREHGVLNRVLLLYDEILRRLNSKGEFPPETLNAAAGVIRRFIEDYHEKLEEDFLFPRFEKAKKLVDLVAVLREQHRAGRLLTDRITSHATPAALKNLDERRQLANHLHLFICMYRPHEAREDTVLFPAFRSVVSPQEYGALGEQFEEKEDQLFGEDGFGKIVDEVAQLEKHLGVYDLSQFTPELHEGK